MKTCLSIINVGAFIGFLSAFPVNAAGATGVPTVDAVANELNIQQLLELKLQFDELANQTAQEIDNARQIGDLGGIVSTLKAYTALLNTDAIKTVMSEFYGLKSDVEDFPEQARAQLGQIYNLPGTDADIRRYLADAGAPASTIDTLAATNGLLLDRQKDILKSDRSLTASKEQSDQALSLLNDRAQDLAGLGDNSVGATMHLNTAVAIQNGGQLNQIVNELREQRAEAMIDRLRVLEAQKRALDAQVKHQQDIASITTTHTPVSNVEFGQ